MQKKIVIVGKSCSGKTFLQNKFIKLGFNPAIITTSRPKRPDEIEGINYHFLSKSEMNIIEQHDGFLDKQSYREFDYGITFEEFNKSNLLILTPKNIKSLKQHNLLKDVLIIYIDTSHELRYKRTAERISTYDDKNKRWVEDDNDFNGFEDYDLKLQVNSDQTLDSLEQIINYNIFK
jgi:guanylate kinase